MSTAVDPHDGPHEIVAVHLLGVPGGWAILREVSADGHHCQIMLAAGEGPREGLTCCVLDDGDDLEHVGVGWDEVADVIVHVVEHVTSGLPPQCCADAERSPR